ncbi:MAG: hypothetical protein WCH46_08265 [bacterium]
MKSQISIVVLFFVVSFGVYGCDTPVQSTSYQDVGEFRWQADGSAIFGFYQSFTVSQNAISLPSIAYDIARFNPDGSLNHLYKNDAKSRPIDPASGDIESYAPAIYVSGDGSTIVAQLENDLYRYSTQTNILVKVETGFHLIAVSPDLKYALGCTSPGNRPHKTIKVLDITGAASRTVTNFDVDELVLEPGLWLSGGTFAFSCRDSAGAHINIYDTTGTLSSVVGAANLPFHNCQYNSGTGNLFVTNWSGGASNHFIEKINLATKSRSVIFAQKAANFVVTNDEQTIVYTMYDSTSTLHFRSRNLSTLAERELPSDVFRIASLSPAEDKLAYVSGNETVNQIRVIPFVRP